MKRFFIIKAILVTSVLFLFNGCTRNLANINGTYIYLEKNIDNNIRLYKHIAGKEYSIGNLLIKFEDITNYSPIYVTLHKNKKLFFIYPTIYGSYMVKKIDVKMDDIKSGKITRTRTDAGGVHMFGSKGKDNVKKSISRG